VKLSDEESRTGLIDTYMDTNETNLYIGGRGQWVSSARH
jgi:hypothetical protein